MGEFVVVVVAVFFIAEAESLVPFEAPFLPLAEPCELLARAHEELHFHLLEFAHAEDELACHDFVAECLAYLRYAEGNAHAAGLLHVEVVHEYALSRFGTQVHRHRAVGGRAHLGFEHEVELAYLCPVLGAGYGADYFFVDYNLAEFFEVVVVHSLREAFVQGVALGLKFEHASVGGAELCLVETFAEAFCSLGYLFGDFVVDFCKMVLDEHVGAIALFGVAVVNQGVVERVDVA